jgi:hypothetical protein
LAVIGQDWRKLKPGIALLKEGRGDHPEERGEK